MGSETEWKGLDEQVFPLHTVSQRQQRLPDLQESGKDPAWPIVRASCAIVQHIWKENKVALGRTSGKGRVCLDGHVLGLWGDHQGL